MRNLVLFLLSILLMLSCDKVSDPYAHIDDVVVDSCDAVFNDTTYNDTSINIKRILIEDFTGHKCPNCPAGTDEAKKIINKYPQNVLIAAIHNSNAFSAPDPDKGFPANFETDAGEKIRVKFQLGQFPIALLNRIDFTGGAGNRGVQYQNWENEIDQLIADAQYMTPSFEMKVTSTYNVNCRTVSVYPRVTTTTALAGEYYLVVYLLESGIISPQEDNRVSPPIIDDYEHNHMLRGAYPQDGDGKLIFTDPASGESFNETEGIKFLLDEGFVAENCELMVFITSKDSEEIIHLDYLHLTED